MTARDPVRHTTGAKSSITKYTGPVRPDIQKLLGGYRNLYPTLDDETFERLTKGVLSNGKMTTKIVLSARGNLLDGYHRCLILLRNGRKVLTEDDYTIDYTATDELSEIKAHVSYQENRRHSSSAEQAAMARSVMRRFGWSAGKFAEEFGFNPERVKKWLARNPDPSFDAEMAAHGRIGKDGKVYTEVPQTDAPPTAKGIREKPRPGQAVVREVNKHVAELTNPELGRWILDNIEADDREGVALRLDSIARAAAAMAESLRALNVPGDGSGAF